MTDIQEIRRLLDERGAEYDEYPHSNGHGFAIDYCDACGDYLSEIQIFGACICVTKKYLTPEQAIAATLGNGMCEMETSWEIRDELGIADAPEDTWGYRCSACGFSFRYDRGIVPNYCPNCRAKVINQ